MSLLFVLSACIVVHEQTAEETVEAPGPVDALLLDADSGDVVITATDAETATITRTLRWAGDEPETDTSLVGTTLQVSSDCPDFAVMCSVDWEIALPVGSSARIDVGSGDVNVSGIDGTVEVSTGSGGVVLADVDGVTAETGSGDLRLTAVGDAVVSTGSGDIEGTELVAETLEASAASGDVNLSFLLEAPVVAIDVDSGSGDVDLTVPGGSWNMDVWSASGDVSLYGLLDDPAAGRSLNAHTGSGDIGVVGG